MPEVAGYREQRKNEIISNINIYSIKLHIYIYNIPELKTIYLRTDLTGGINNTKSNDATVNIYIVNKIFTVI